MSQSVFENKSVSKAYFSMSIPVVLSMIITVIYNITDTYFIALTKNTDLVAGVSLCAPVFTLLMGFGNIFGQGGNSLISRLLGKNDRDNLSRVSSFCFYVAILFGAITGIIMLLFRIPLLHVLGADSSTLSYALPYFTWFAIGAPAVTLSFIHTNLLRSEGMAKQSMIGTVGGSVVNIILDPILIFACRLGAAGAAIATICGYLFTVMYCLHIVRTKSNVLSLDIRKWQILPSHAVQLFSIGTSAALSNFTQSICLILVNHQLLQYGSDKIAVMGIVQKISTIVMLIVVGFSFGGAPLIGYYYGANDTIQLKKLLRFVLRFLCLTALVLSCILFLTAPFSVSLFLDDSGLIQIGVFMLRAQISSMVFMAVVLFLTVYFQATGKAVPSFALALSRQGIIFIFVLYLASWLWGYHGVVLTQLIADVLSAVFAVVLYSHRDRF